MSGAAVQLEMTRHTATGPWVVWGGLLPSGSLKHLTFAHYLQGLEHAQHTGWIEISEGCTALTLDWFAQRRRVPLAIVCSPAGAQSLRQRGIQAELIVPGSLAQALQICQVRQQQGWHWPQQLCNPELIAAVRAWAPALLQVLRTAPEVDTVVTGFGTGATLVGLQAELGAHGYRVLGVEAPAGVAVPGLRNYAQQNLGERDLYHAHRERSPLLAARWSAGVPGSALALLLAQDFCTPAERVCVLSHDGVPGCS